MDSREPPHPPPPHQHQQPPPNMMVGVGPTSFPNTITPSMMAPATARFPFNSVVHHQQHQHQHQHQHQPPPPSNTTAATNNNNPSEPYAHTTTTTTNNNSNMTQPYDDSSSALKPCGFSATDSAKKKRGRPRKYSPDGNIALGLAPTHVSPSSATRGPDSADGTPSTEPLAKKNRGRPPGSGKKQLDALGAGGIGFTPHVILVETGEDIAAKIMAFCQQGPRTVCILSANGAVCNVTLRQAGSSGGTVAYEGRFEIISLTGSLLLSDDDSGRNRTGGLNVSLAGSDGRVLGGGVVGMLTAASPVQVIVGSFIADGKKYSSNNLKAGPSSAPPSSQMLTFGTPMTPTSPTSQGPSTESSDDNDNTPFSRGPVGLYNNNAAGQPMHNMPMYHQLWAGQTQQ